VIKASLGLGDIEFIEGRFAPPEHWPWSLRIAGRARIANAKKPTAGILTISPLFGRAEFTSDSSVKRRERYGMLGAIGLVPGIICGFVAFVMELWFFFACDGILTPDLGNPGCAISYDSVLDFGLMRPALWGVGACTLWVAVVAALAFLDRRTHAEAIVVLPDDLSRVLAFASRRLEALQKQKKEAHESARRRKPGQSWVLGQVASAIGESVGGKFVGLIAEAAAEAAIEGQDASDAPLEQKIHDRSGQLLQLVIEYNLLMRGKPRRRTGDRRKSAAETI
jgi:hypothetical protein